MIEGTAPGATPGHGSGTVVFRTDASSTIGHGHVMRCLTLAEALRARGGAVWFVCREHEGHLCNLIERRGFAVQRLLRTLEFRPDATPAHAAWLGAPWQEDARETAAAIAATGERPDWLVVDHYAIDQRWESALRDAAARVLVVDDLADRPHHCDVLLDQNEVASMDARYVGKVPMGCTVLAGARYALLQEAYAALRGRVVPRGGVTRILIFFGGADPANLTGRALAAFLGLGRDDVHADVVLPGSSSHCESVRAQAAGHPNITLHEMLPTLAPLMRVADLAVGASGATTWERLCLGLPALVVTLAANQRPVASHLASLGLVRWLGDEADVTEAVLARAISDVVARGVDPAWSRRCLEAVDGRGAERVCMALSAGSAAGGDTRNVEGAGGMA